MTGILALHLGGLKVGWADGSPDDTPRCGSWKLAEHHRDHGAIAAAFSDALGDHCALGKPDRLVLTSGLGDIKTGDEAAQGVIRVGTAFIAQLYAWRRKIPVSLLIADEIKAAHLPRSQAAMHDRVRTWCEMRGWHPATPIAAHALLLWFHAACAT